MVWAGYYNTTVLKNGFSVVSDVQVRTKDWLSQWSQQLVRSGVSYGVNQRLAVTAGFAFFRTAQTLNGAVAFKKEWRPWQEVSVRLVQKGTSFTQRLRTEQRFMQQVEDEKLTSDYRFMFRLRYKADVQWPLGKSNLSAALGNEILVNPSEIGGEDFLDQNRASASLFWQVVPGLNMQLQYIKIIQKKYRMNAIDNQDVVRVNIHHQLKRKNK